MESKIREYDSEGIRVRYDLKRCIHVAECVRGLPRVFDADRRPWIDPKEGAPDEIADVVRRCPSGALQFERLDGGVQERPPGATRSAPAHRSRPRGPRPSSRSTRAGSGPCGRS